MKFKNHRPEYPNTYNLDNLVHFLEQSGFKVEYEFEYKEQRFYSIKREKIVGQIFCGILYADHISCFNKPSSCPLKLKLPSSDSELRWLLSRLNFWRSRKGYNLSNKYECSLWDYEYPVYPYRLKSSLDKELTTDSV